MALDSPWLPSTEPPPSDWALLSAVARMVAFSVTSRVTSPSSASTLDSLMKASTPLRTSLTTTMPPAATEFESLTLMPSGTRSLSGSSFHRSRLE